MFKGVVLCSVVMFGLSGCITQESTPTPETKPVAKATAPKPTNQAPGVSRTPPTVKSLAKSVAAQDAWIWKVFQKNSWQYTETQRIRLSGRRVLVASLDDKAKRVKLLLYPDEGKTSPNPKKVFTAPKSTQHSESFYLVQEQSTVYLAVFGRSSSGARIFALDSKDFSVRWQYQTKALGPIKHLEYRNETQLRLGSKDELIVYGHEAYGSYIEVINRKTGAMMRHRRVNKSLLSTTQEQATFRDLRPKEVKTIAAKTKGEDAMYRLSFVTKTKDSPEHIYTLDRVNATDDVQWSKTFKPRFVGQATMVECGQLLVAAHHSRIATGATVEAFDSMTGQPRWKTTAFAAGPVSHSKYSNQTVLRCDAKQRPVLVGRESAASYKETFDVKTGRTLSNIRFYR